MLPFFSQERENPLLISFLALFDTHTKDSVMALLPQCHINKCHSKQFVCHNANKSMIRSYSILLRPTGSSRAKTVWGWGMFSLGQTFKWAVYKSSFLFYIFECLSFNHFSFFKRYFFPENLRSK